MAEAGKGWIGGVVSLAQQWQVLVTAIAAGTALWFGFAEQRRKQVEVNRAAVMAAKAVEPEAFARDPYATVAEFRVSYPEHAFCAALGYFLADATRQGPTVGTDVARRMGDALGVQVERLAAQGGLTLGAIEELAAAAAGDGSGLDACPALRPPLGFRAWAMWPDCRVLIETFAQTRCQARAAEARRASVAAEIGAGEAPPTAPDLDAAKGPDALAGSREPSLPLAAPDPSCGVDPPMVFVQFTGDPAPAEALRAKLEAAGWSAPGIEAVPGVRPRGDVRYYWPEQATCAAALAQSLAGAVGIEFTTVSLAGRYRNLPRGRMEIWLPAG
jgi:hypothetical protein